MRASCSSWATGRTASVYRIRLDTNELSRVTGPGIRSRASPPSARRSHAPSARLLASRLLGGRLRHRDDEARAGRTGDAVMAGSRLELPSVPLPGEAGRSVEAESATFGARAYRDDMSLEASANLSQRRRRAFGNYLRAGMGFGFGDMLGDQQLGWPSRAACGSTTSPRACLAPQPPSRLNWGVSVDYLPTVFGSAKREDDEGPTPCVAWPIPPAVAPAAGRPGDLPFNRSQRVEFSAGFRNVTCGREVETRLIAVPSFRERSATARLPGGDPFSCSRQAWRWCRTRRYGPTSPILGGRSRRRSRRPSAASATRPCSPTTGGTDASAPSRSRCEAARRAAGGGRPAPDAAGPFCATRCADNLRTLASRSCEPGQADCSLFDVLSGSRLIAGNV